MTDREIDTLIAEHLFKAEFSSKSNRTYICVSGDGWEQLPCYSTNPAACALVRAELRRRGYFFEYEYMPHKGKVHYCGIYEVDKDVGPRVGVSYADTEERAICLAVLKALENGRPESLSPE